MACATLKRRLKLEPLHSPQSENSKRRRHTVSGGGSPGTVTLDKGVALSPSLTKDQVSTHIRHELTRLNRHRQLTNMGAENTDAWKDHKLVGGDGATKHWRFDESLEGEEYHTAHQNQDDKPIFTFREVELICERMLKEREDHLQETYGQALRIQMAEQYDIFVKFTHDQIQKGAHAAYNSYLS